MTDSQSNTVPLDSGRVEEVVQSVRGTLDHHKLYNEARQRMMRDMTGEGFDYHLVRVVIEHMGEGEREKIVAWLRSNSRAMLPGYAEIVSAFADAISRGDHLKGET